MVGKIFISYRRDDVRSDARGIYDRLAAKYGTAGVFMDVRDLSGGQVFDQVIADALAQSDVLLAVIGPNWMNLLSARMAANGRDLMREEIATALKYNLLVIPVLIERSPLLDADSLPDDIRMLAARETEEVRFKYFDRDMENITAAINKWREERARKAIKNSEQLWVWLKKRPIEVPRAIAARAALRTLPWACDTAERLAQKRAQATAPPATSEQAGQVLSQEDQEYRQAMQAYEAIQQEQLEKADGHLLKVFRGNAIAWFAAVGSNHVTDELKAAALAAARDIDPLSFEIDVAPAAHNAAIAAIADTVRTRTTTPHLEPAGRYAARAATSLGFDPLALAADLEWFDRGQSGPSADSHAPLARRCHAGRLGVSLATPANGPAHHRSELGDMDQVVRRPRSRSTVRCRNRAQARAGTCKGLEPAASFRQQIHRATCRRTSKPLIADLQDAAATPQCLK